MSNNLLTTDNIINTEEQNMTTQINSLNEKLFTELNSTEAELIQGGWDFEGWRDIRYSTNNKRIAAANSGLEYLTYNDQMSFINVRSGKWRLYEDAHYQGKYRDFKPGKYNLTDYSWYQGGNMNDRVSSLRRIA